MLRKYLYTVILLIMLVQLLGSLDTASAQEGIEPASQTQALLYDEARTVYLGNLARRDNGVPPLRWNLQLTDAARWYAWDSIVNRPGDFCGHQDTLGRWPNERALLFGYLGSAGAENSICGYGINPEASINAWMSSSGHRDNLLDANSREIGVGYYQLGSGRGYGVQDFGSDSAYAPVIIENEAPNTTSANVNLYIYNRSNSGGFAGSDAATQMMVSNDAQFCNASWEPFSTNKSWTLADGAGWRNLYVKTRDNLNRTATVSDTIYLGSNIPLNELGPAQMSTTQSQVTILNLTGGTLPQVQFSPGWVVDDTNESFKKWSGNGERVNDSAAWGGTAYRLFPGDGESYAWANDWNFIRDTPLVAYFRFKVNNNTSSSEVGRISVDGSGTTYGPVILHGTDFTAPNQYQEFAISFVNNTNPDNSWLTFNFWRSGNADLYLDAVSIFSAPQTVASPLTWTIPGNNYRGQGIWARYTNGSQFSNIFDAVTDQEFPFTISGAAGLAGTTLLYNQCTPMTITADTSNNYSIRMSRGWTGTITPYKKGYLFSPLSRTYSDLENTQTNQNYTAQFCGSCADVNTMLAGDFTAPYTLDVNQSRRDSYTSMNKGPAVIMSTNSVPIIASQRVLYGEGSYSEMMGLPAAQVTKEYLFPYYNNVAMDSQLRVSNVGGAGTTISVYLGVDKIDEYTLAAGGASRKNYAGRNGGPLRVTSSASDILATTRVLYGGNSYSELMGLPVEQLTKEYLFPYYNNVAMNSQLRVSNVGGVDTTITVYLGTTQIDSYSLAAGGATRKNYTGRNSGPLRVTSSDSDILTTIRVLYGDGSYSELMGFPAGQLAQSYWYPVYDNTAVSSQLRVSNVGSNITTITVYAGGTQIDSYTLAAGGATRKNYSQNTGPLHVVSSSQPILTTIRLLYGNSYYEMTGLPESQLSTQYFFPWYNNKAMESELRFAVP
jgi:uncharacterized protein YkwD